MSTPLKAAEDGVVYRVKGGEGLDYHYVILAHSDGILTLYGHMYDITVTEGQYVQRGQTIGLSGGMPGTRGAGYLTTGPHLHFEVFDNGTRVDPLFYLDLSSSEIQEKYVPQAYKYLIPKEEDDNGSVTIDPK
jgi:murein DD-endopeptidase MepM/ murein hydrolase activator NlpD